MKKSILILFIVAIMFVGCNSKKEEKSKEEKEKMTIDERVEYELENMSLDEKIGQMMIVFYEKEVMDSTLKSALEEVKPGGFILFKENITTYENTLKLIKEIKETADIPMFISIDEEGGIVQRLKALLDVKATDVPYMYSVGEKNDLELTKSVGKLLAEELRVFGINLDFAPVLDVYSNPNNQVIGRRSFGSDKELVAKHGIALSNGLEENGVLSVYKHFPGHGNTATDSHFSLPVLDLTKEELDEVDVYPFKEAIKNNAKMIMVGHLAVPKLTGDETPASLSKKVVTDYLRNELKFDGLIVTDGLNMGALTNYYSKDEICAKAVEAGVDILLMPSSSRQCLKSVKQAIEDGKFDEERIDESVRKILKLKYEYIEKDYDNYLPKEYLNNSEHQAIVDKINQ